MLKTVTDERVALAQASVATVQDFCEKGFSQCGTVNTSKEFGIAAELAGSRARGAVSAAIRARAEHRFAASVAFREKQRVSQLLPRRLYPDAEPAEADDSPPARRSVGFCSLPVSSYQEDSDDDRDWVRTHAEVPWRRQYIRVPQNTTLGQMVKRDPEQAAKYNLLLVPSWTNNKPWPPPPLPSHLGGHPDKPGSPRGKTSDGSGKFGRGGRSPMAEHRHTGPTALRRWKDLRAFAGFIGQYKGKDPRDNNTIKRHTKVMTREKTMTPSQQEVSEGRINLYSAEEALTTEEIDFLAEIFTRYSYSNGGRLSRRGLQLAMKAAGIPEPDTFADQSTLRMVQEEVIKFCRGESEVFSTDELPNPLSDEKGCWELREFQLMVAGVHEVERQQMRSKHSDLGCEFNLDGDTVGDLFGLFQDYADEDCTTISVPAFQQCLSKFDVYPSPDEMKILLAATESDTTLTFRDFVRVIVTLCEILGLWRPESEGEELLRRTSTSAARGMARLSSEQSEVPDDEE